MKICLYCTCMGQSCKTLPKDKLAEALGGDVRLIEVDRLCHAESCAQALKENASQLHDSGMVAVAACSLGARGDQAMSCLAEAVPGISAELADIRESCIWPSAGAPASEVAAQAADLVNMAFARLESAPAEVEPSPTSQRVLVVGAGPAGMAAASTLTGLGVPVVVAEKRGGAGGMLGVVGRIFPYMDRGPDMVNTFAMKDVTLLSDAEVTDIRREDGSWMVEMRGPKGTGKAPFGAVVLATGAQAVLPGKKFSAGTLKGVISQMEMDTTLSDVEEKRKPIAALPAHVVFLQCVNARDEEHPYCSAICCPTAVKNAIRLKALLPLAEITVIHRQMCMPGIALEEMYQRAMKMGVRFVRCDDMENLAISGEGEVQSVTIPASAGAASETLRADRVVCSTPMRPTPASKRLALGLGLRTDAMGFIAGHEPAHPLETDAEGIFVCGSARWPAYVSQAIDQGKAAGVMAARFMREQRMPLDEMPDPAPAARIRTDLCSGCGRCSEACPHGACHVGKDGLAHVESALCRRCGACAAVCPCNAACLPLGVPSSRELLAALGVAHPTQRRLS